MNAIAVDLDSVVGDTRPLWLAWLEDAAHRYRTIAALDPAALPEDRAAAAAELDRWAARGVGDWRAALERFAEDRAPLFFRPDPLVGPALRRLAAAGTRVGMFTDAPEPLARIALAHVGVSRHIDAFEVGAGARERLLARLGAETVVVRSREDLVALAA